MSAEPVTSAAADDGFEYLAWAQDPDGRIVDWTKRPQRQPKFWFRCGIALIRARHPGVTGVLLRRPAGSRDDWQIVEEMS